MNPIGWSPRRYAWLGAALFMGLWPLLADGVPGLNAFDSSRLLQVGLLMALGVGIFLEAQAPWRRAGALWLGFLIPSGALAVFAPVPVRAWQEWALFASLALLAAAVARDSCLPDSDAWSWRRLATLCTVAYGVVCLALAFCAQSQAVGLRTEVWLPGFENRRFYNHAQTVVLPWVAWDAVRSTGRWRWLALSALALGIAVLCLTGGRATGLAMLTVALIWICFDVGRRRLAKVWIAGIAAGVTIAAAVLLWPAVFGLPIGLPGDLTVPVRGSESDRWQMWLEAVQTWRQSPWLGIGPAHWAYGFRPQAAHPHNFYLQVLVEWGALVALPLFGALTWLLLRLWRSVSRSPTFQEQEVALVLLATGVGIAVDSLFSGNWVMPHSQTWIALWLGLAWQAGTPKQVQMPQIPRWSGMLPWLLAFMLLPDAIHLVTSPGVVPTGVDGTVLHPRMFLQGHFFKP